MSAKFYRECIEKNMRHILEVFREFANDNDFGEDYFNSGRGTKLNDLINYIYFLDRQFNPEPEVTVEMIFDEITKYSDFTKKVFHKLSFLCIILNIFAQQKEMFSPAKFWPTMLKFIAEIKDRKTFLIDFASKAVSQYLVHNPTYVIDIFEVFESGRNTISTISFLNNLKIPTKLSNKEHIKIATIMLRVCCINARLIPIEVLKSALLNIYSQITIESESDIHEILNSPVISSSEISKLLTSAVYITLPNVDVMSHHIDDFILFASTSDCIKQTFAILENVFSQITELPPERADDMTKVLKTFINHIPLSTLQTENAPTRAAFFIGHLSKLNKDIPINVISHYFQSGDINCDILHVLINFPICGGFENFINDDITLISPIISNICRCWDLNATHQNIVAFPKALLFYVKMAITVIKNIKRIDDSQAMQNIMNKTKDKVEDAISELPFDELQTMCIIMTFHKDKNVRLASYILLVAVGELFQAANTDWKTYEQEQQQFIIRFTSDYNYVTKKMFGKPREIEQLLEEDGIRNDCSDFMFKMLASRNHPLAIPVFKSMVKYSEKMPWFLEGVASMYSMELHDLMGASFIAPAQFISIISSTKSHKFIAKMSGTGLPLLVPHISFEQGLDDIAAYIRYILQCWEENPKTFDTASGKTFVDKVIALFDARPDITRCNDYVVALGIICSLITAGKVPHTPKVTEFYVVVLTAVQRDTLNKDKDIIKAAHSTLLCLLKNGECTIQSVSFLNDVTNYDLTFHTISEILKIDTDQGKKLIITFISYAPIQTADALLKYRPKKILESDIFFAFLMSEGVQKSSVDYLDQYINELYPDLYTDFKKSKPDTFLIEGFPQYIQLYMKQVENMRHNSPHDVHLLTLVRVMTKILNTQNQLSEESILTGLKLANDISCKTLTFTTSAKCLWHALLSKKDRAMFIFKSLFDLDVSRNSIDLCLKHCPQEFVPDIVEKMQDFMLSLMIQRATIKITNNRLKLFKLFSKTPITPILLAQAGIFLFSKVPAMQYTSKRKILEVIGKPVANDISNLQLLEECYKVVGNEFTQACKLYAIKVFSITKDKDMFKGCFLFMLTSSNVFPSTNFDQVIQRISEVVKTNFEDPAEFDKFFSQMFNALRESIDVHQLAIPLLISLMKHSASWVEYGFPNVNLQIAQVYIAIVRRGYDDPGVIQNLEAAFRLIIFGDRIYASLLSSVINRVNFNNMKCPTAKIWRAILAGNAVLEEDMMSKELLKSFMRASVFGEFIIPQKISILFRSTPTNGCAMRKSFVKKFTRFLATSNEVLPSNALNILRAIIFCSGSLNLRPLRKVEVYRNITKIVEDNSSFESSN